MSMRGVDIKGCFQPGNNLSGANLSGATGRLVRLARMTLKGVNLSEAQFYYCFFNGSDLEGASLEGASLAFSNFESANLRGANLRFTDLRNTYWKGADLTGADLTGADLRGADLEHANLQDIITDGILFDDMTSLPTGFKMNRFGVVNITLSTGDKTLVEFFGLDQYSDNVKMVIGNVLEKIRTRGH